MRKRKGVSFIELIIYMLLTSFAFTLVVQSTNYKIANEKSIDVQYDVAAVDSYIVNIYRDFHEAMGVSVEKEDNGITMLMFTMNDGSSETYSFSLNDQACYRNGLKQFDAQSMTVLKSTGQLFVTIKLEDERLFEFNIYR